MQIGEGMTLETQTQNNKCPFEETCYPLDYEDTDFYEKNCAGHFSNPNFKERTYNNCEIYKQLIQEVEERR